MQATITQALAEHSFTAIDFETANEQRSSACAVAVVRVERGQVVESYETLLRPRELRVSWGNQQVHGIAEADLRHAPSLADVWPQLLPYLYRQPVVAHNSAFDMSVLDYTCRDFDLASPPLHCLCSVKLARAAWPQLGGYRLNLLAAHFQLALQHHNALSDAVACAEITLRALRSGAPLPLCFKQRELTAGLARRAAQATG